MYLVICVFCINKCNIIFLFKKFVYICINKNNYIMTHKELSEELTTILPLEVELLHNEDYRQNLKDSELYSNNYTIQIIDGIVSKTLIYFNAGSYFEQDESEFTELEIEINHVKVFDKEDNEIELTDNQHLRLCNYIRVHKVIE